MCYRHLFFFKFILSDRYENTHKEILKKFKKRRININKNNYIKHDILLEPISSRIRIELYNYNYYLGRIYDFNRKLINR